VTRPSDWKAVFGISDPTPGDPWAIRRMQRSWSDLADDAEAAENKLRQLLGDAAISGWIGEGGDAFRKKTYDLPGQLGTCHNSYRLAADALSTWATRLETHQGDADRALVQGRAAKADLDAASASVTSASGSDVLAFLERYADTPPPAAVTPPSEEAIRNARARLSSAQSAQSGAQGRFDAARQLALDAGSLREEDGRTAATKIREASDAGIPERSRWEKFKDWAADAWNIIVEICKIVVLVLGIVALIIGGPLAWVVFAAALLVLADTIMKYLKGEASLWDVGLAALACIPCTKGLTTLSELSAAFRSGGMLGAGAHLLSAGRTAIVEMAAAVRSLASSTSLAIREFTASGILALTLRFGRPSEVAAEAATAIHAPNMYGPGGINLGALHLPSDGPVGDLLADYDRFGGMSPEDFVSAWGDGHGGYDWTNVVNDGFLGDRVPMDMNPGELLDRFGPSNGRYLSPVGTPFGERGLPPASIDATVPNFGYHQYEVVTPFTADVGYIAPAMGQDGGGLQVFLNGANVPEFTGGWFNVDWLLSHGYIKEAPL